MSVPTFSKQERAHKFSRKSNDCCAIKARSQELRYCEDNRRLDAVVSEEYKQSKLDDRFQEVNPLKGRIRLSVLSLNSQEGGILMRSLWETGRYISK